MTIKGLLISLAAIGFGLLVVADGPPEQRREGGEIVTVPRHAQGAAPPALAPQSPAASIDVAPPSRLEPEAPPAEIWSTPAEFAPSD